MKDPQAPKDPQARTVEANKRVQEELDFSDQEDFADAGRGFVGSIPHARITNARGDVVWSLEPYGFLNEKDAPLSVNPSLWRLSRLNMRNGLFKVTDRIFQVRGFDLANLTFIEGRSGLILIDPLTFAEPAAAALALYRQHRGDRPVHTVIYSHSHPDHYGGVKGVISAEEVRAGRVQVIAPAGFMDAVVDETVLAGVPMRRRAMFQFGPTLAPGPRSHVDSGLGKAMGRGSVGLIPPTRIIEQMRETHEIDGVQIVFQLTPETEAPAEMNFFFPDDRALNLAENACQTMHNLCPLRGAKTRDALAWSRYLDEALSDFLPHVDVVFAQHHWPVWGQKRAARYVAEQRDMYRYLHDQTLRLMSHGLTPREIAEELMMPSDLSRRWHARGYYGAVAHNVQAIYAHYIGPYDGNPANLHALPPAAAGTKYVEYMGGAQALMHKARADFARGEYRWVTQALNHLVFAQPDHREARELCADAMEQLAYQSESATWRNSYVLGARELREGSPRPVVSRSGVGNADLVAVLPVDKYLDTLAIRVNGLAAQHLRARIDWVMPDEGSTHRLTLSNGALSHLPGSHGPDADATIKLDRQGIATMLMQGTTLLAALEAGQLQVQGNTALLREFFGTLEGFSPFFNIIEP